MQVVKEYSRVTTTSESLIDLVITNLKNLQCKIVKEQQISDHCMLSVNLNCGKKKSTENCDTIEIRSRKNYSQESLNYALNNNF